ncbi:SDR family oxidoreductase [Sporolactobacillus pectinivorans]|uniref:SDR family oxidoreductase n=1 Tax=Sporolactobacillus pectinivorans TaxID=1591408 RepID=UPI000C2581EA|nr:NAD(P)H-binding protein [Sporolactobacillus pectinivorans]
MKITLTGSLGHVGLPLTKQLAASGHDVTVISSNENRKEQIEQLGARAAIGLIQDESFLADSFAGADAVYLMLALSSSFDKNVDVMDLGRQQAAVYANAVRRSGVKRVINLSSIGANLGKEAGTLYVYNIIEGILSNLEGVGITFVRPTSMYYNLFGFLNTIKTQGVIATNYGNNITQSWVAPADIADVVAEELMTPLTGTKVRYVASDELTGQETAQILGKAIGMPDLTWVEISDEQRLEALEKAGINKAIAAGLVQMSANQRTHTFYEDYKRHHPKLGKIKMADFANDFAKVYNKR